MFINVLNTRPTKFIKLTLLVLVFLSSLNMFEPFIGKYVPVFLYDLKAKTIFQIKQKINAPNEKTRAAGIPKSEI